MPKQVISLLAKDLRAVLWQGSRGFFAMVLENSFMRTRIFSVCSQAAELGVFFAAAVVLAVGLMGLR